MNGIEAVRAYFVARIHGCTVAPFTDPVTRLHGTVGFDIVVGESMRTVEVTLDLLRLDHQVDLESHLDRAGLVEWVRSGECCGVLVSSTGARRIASRRRRELGDSRSDGERTFLVVGSDPSVADVVDGFLRALGATSCRVDSAAAAEEMLAEVRFDGVIVDVRGPDAVELGWLAGFAADAAETTGRRVACVGGPISRDRRRRLERAGVSVLGKPFSIADFASALGVGIDTGRAASGD